MEYYKIPKPELDEFLHKYKIDEVDQSEGYELYSQRDPRWSSKKLGFSGDKIGQYGCFLTSLAMMVKKRPDEVNEILKQANAFSGALIKTREASKALNLDIIETGDPVIPNRDKNINNMPQYSPSIKEVKMGKSQHFVLRIIENSKRYIIDSWDGQKKAINYYPFISYRLFKQK